MITSAEIEKRDAETAAAFDDPRPGDEVVVMEASPPCVVPDDGKVISFATKADFRKKYSWLKCPCGSTIWNGETP